MRIINREALNAVALFILQGMFISSAFATEWIDCNGKKIWAGLLVNSEDDHVIHFHFDIADDFIDDIDISQMQVSTKQHRATMRGKSQLIGDVSLVIEALQGVLITKTGDHELTCDWSAF